MKFIFLLTLLSYSLSSAYASSKNCTDKPRSSWMKIETFKEKITAKGFKIRKFKQPGTCYEIYGKDKDGKEVEVYFNPVDASIKKIEFED